MGIDVSKASRQAAQLAEHANTLRSAKNKLSTVASNLNNHWKATEMQYVNKAINHISNEIRMLETKLSNLQSDIVVAALEIKREEDERERKLKAAAEAVAKAKEAEAKAKATATTQNNY